jgi:hypothetical protein
MSSGALRRASRAEVQKQLRRGGDAIQFVNHTLRSLFAGEFTSPSNFVALTRPPKTIEQHGTPHFVT